MEPNNFFTVPKSNLDTFEKKEGNVNFPIKFLYGFLCCNLLLILLIKFNPPQNGVFGVSVAILAISSIAGLTSSFTQSERKIIYIPAGIIVSFTVLYLLGIFLK